MAFVSDLEEHLHELNIDLLIVAEKKVITQKERLKILKGLIEINKFHSEARQLSEIFCSFNSDFMRMNLFQQNHD